MTPPSLGRTRPVGELAWHWLKAKGKMMIDPLCGTRKTTGYLAWTETPERITCRRCLVLYQQGAR